MLYGEHLIAVPLTQQPSFVLIFSISIVQNANLPKDFNLDNGQFQYGANVSLKDEVLS